MAILVDAAGIGRLFGTAVGDVWARVRANRKKRHRNSMATECMI